MLSDDEMRQLLIDKGKALVEAEHGAEVAARCTPVESVLTVLVQYGRAVEAAVLATPIDMVLHCPACGLQHIDRPEADGNWTIPMPGAWTNPPHRSHLCAGCGHVWRPADVPTNGVAAVQTRGKADSPIAAPRDGVPPALDVRRILLDVVPGDGDGLEVYAESVADVESRMTELWERIPDEDGSLPQRAVNAEILERLHEYTRAVVDEATSLNHASAKAYAALARSNLLDSLGVTP